ncbi:MAG: efflux RND transporter periplasmic adaptor subunit [Deltaproteobacteria bacterium]|nr:efflux RND transporter periplasmic adaptor subunit [Deltaproteobacteria bacterium]
MNTTIKTFTMLLAVSALAPALAACEPSRSAEPTRAESAGQAPVKAGAVIPVTLVPVQRLPAERPVRALGRVTHDRDLELGFKTGGLVAEVLVAEGDRVEAGTVVARLDARELDAAVAQASAGLAKARRDLDRAQGLVDEAVIPGAQRDDARTAVQVASAVLAGARFNRGTTELVAPGPGVVLRRLGEPGKVMGPGMPIVVLGLDADDGRPRVDVGVSAREAGLLRVGDAATARLDGRDEIVAEVAAEVVEIAPALTPGTDQIRVTVALPLGTAAPRGLVVSVGFELARAGVLPAVPISAIAEGHGRQAWVYTLAPDGQGVVRHEVVVAGVRADGQVLVRAGLDGVDAVVDAGAAWLDPEAKVVVTPSIAVREETAP